MSQIRASMASLRTRQGLSVYNIFAFNEVFHGLRVTRGGSCRRSAFPMRAHSAHILHARAFTFKDGSGYKNERWQKNGSTHEEKCRFKGKHKLGGGKKANAIASARASLGISPDVQISHAQLRAAYLAAALQCHPDVQSRPKKEERLQEEESHETDEGGGRGGTCRKEFVTVRAAYEYLLSHTTSSGDHTRCNTPEDYHFATMEEEAVYRHQCEAWLNTSAELVEEVKADPMFRQWIQGKTDSARVWTNFFTVHGGVEYVNGQAQLRPWKLRLGIEQGDTQGKGKIRRRKR